MSFSRSCFVNLASFSRFCQFSEFFALLSILRVDRASCFVKLASSSRFCQFSGKSEDWVREFREVGCLETGIKGSRRPWGWEFWHLRSHFKDLGFSIPDDDSGL